MEKRKLTKKVKLLIWVLLIIIILLALNSQSRYIPSDDGKSGVFITNYWPTQFKDPITGNYAPQYSMSFVVWYGYEPDTVQVEINQGEKIDARSVEKRKDSYIDIKLWNWLCALHLPRLSYYPISLYPFPPTGEKLTVNWENEIGEKVLTSFDISVPN